jgi:biotin synthase
VTAGDRQLLKQFLEEAVTILEESARSTDLAHSYERRLRARGEEQAALAEEARRVRDALGESRLIVRGSLEFSNHCSQACSFCGMTRHNRELPRYRMTFDQIATVIDGLAELGVTDLHLASGEDHQFLTQTMVAVIKKAVDVGLEVTLVVGHRPVADYEVWRDAGASRYILKVETTNPSLFDAARVGTHLQTRVGHLLLLRKLGYRVGTGVICGLPLQTPADLARDLVFLKRLDPDMASVSRFLPNPGSRYHGESEGDPDLTLNLISLARIEIQRSNLRIPAGTTLGRRQSDAVLHGANVASIHVTPPEYAELYSADRIHERNLTQLETLRMIAAETGLPLALRRSQAQV